MERECHLFFKTPHGKRETYTVYRGQLIVRATRQYHDYPGSRSRSVRETVIYLFVTDPEARENGWDLYCADHPNNINSAKREIDTILEKGVR